MTKIHLYLNLGSAISLNTKLHIFKLINLDNIVSKKENKNIERTANIPQTQVSY